MRHNAPGRSLEYGGRFRRPSKTLRRDCMAENQGSRTGMCSVGASIGQRHCGLWRAAMKLLAPFPRGTCLAGSLGGGAHCRGCCLAHATLPLRHERRGRLADASHYLNCSAAAPRLRSPGFGLTRLQRSHGRSCRHRGGGPQRLVAAACRFCHFCDGKPELRLRTLIAVAVEIWKIKKLIKGLESARG